MSKWRKKPVIIEAFKWTGDIKPFPKDFQEAICLLNHQQHLDVLPAHIHTLEGVHSITDGDWIIRGVAGEFYPCRDDIFQKTYEKFEL